MRRSAALAVAAALVLASCSQDAADDRALVEVFGPLTGREAEQLGRALDEVSAGTSVQLRYIGVTSFPEQLADRLEQGDRPGIALLPQPGVLDDLYERGVVEPLPEELAAQARSSYPAQLVDLVTIDGQPRATWLTIDVKGLVWYRPEVLAGLGESAPTSLAELAALSDRLRTTEGLSTWCLTMEAGASTGWVGTDWVEDYVLRRLGPGAYDRWTTGELRFDSPEVVAVFDELDALLRAPGAVAGGNRAVLQTPWEDSARALFLEPSRCVLLRQADFVRQSFPDGTEIGPEGDVDFFVLPAAASSGQAPLTVGGNLAVPLRSGPEVAEAMALLASAELGEALARTGAFLSPHLGVDPTSVTDPTDRRLLELLGDTPVVRFDGSDVMPPAVGTGSFWEGMRAFFAGERVDAVVEGIQQGWPSGAEDP